MLFRSRRFAQVLALGRGFCLGTLSPAMLNRVVAWSAQEEDVRARHNVPCFNRQGRLDSEYHESGDHDPQYTLHSPVRAGKPVPALAPMIST